MKQEIKDRLKKLYIYKWYHKIDILLYHLKYDKKIEKKNSYFNAEGLELLVQFSKVLNENQILFWLEFGTLLGYYREHDFIKHDNDLDTGAFLKDAPKIRHALTSKGFNLVRQYHVLNEDGLEECYKFKHTTIDIFYFSEDNDTLYCNSFMPLQKITNRKLNKEVPSLVKRIDFPNNGFFKTTFKECDVYVPNKTDEYLQKHYGKNYMIPNPNFDSVKEATNIKYYSYEEKQGVAILSEKYL